MDEAIRARSTEEIKEEVQKKNSWTDNNIHEIYKFSNAPIIKITFKQTPPATKSKDQGILMFSMRIPPRQIENEEYTPIQTCMRCYKTRATPYKPVP